MSTFIATTCATCDAPIGYWSPTPVGCWQVCRDCQAAECEYFCAACDAADRAAGGPGVWSVAHIESCEHGVADHHCIVPDPLWPWPPPHDDRPQGVPFRNGAPVWPQPT